MTRRAARRCGTLAVLDPSPYSESLRAEAERLLWRYVVEVVEAFDLCPWSRRARLQGEVRVEVCAPAGATAAAARICADPRVVMGMIVFPTWPRSALDASSLRRLRDDLLASPLARTIAIADFHPDATADLTTPARAVPWFRRSPDPLLQLVRLSVLADLRRPAPPPALAAQAAMLVGHGPAPARSVSDQVAERNHATAHADGDAIAAAVAAIHADRDASYASLDRRVDQDAVMASSR